MLVLALEKGAEHRNMIAGRGKLDPDKIGGKEFQLAVDSLKSSK